MACIRRPSLGFNDEGMGEQPGTGMDLKTQKFRSTLVSLLVPLYLQDALLSGGQRQLQF